MRFGVLLNFTVVRFNLNQRRGTGIGFFKVDGEDEEVFAHTDGHRKSLVLVPGKGPQPAEFGSEQRTMPKARMRGVLVAERSNRAGKGPRAKWWALDTGPVAQQRHAQERLQAGLARQSARQSSEAGIEPIYQICAAGHFRLATGVRLEFDVTLAEEVLRKLPGKDEIDDLIRRLERSHSVTIGETWFERRLGNGEFEQCQTPSFWERVRISPEADEEAPVRNVGGVRALMMTDDDDPGRFVDLGEGRKE